MPDSIREMEYKYSKQWNWLLPSEVAKMVLGYLMNDPKLSSSKETFLNESPHLGEYREVFKKGNVYSFFLQCVALEDILEEYYQIVHEVKVLVSKYPWLISKSGSICQQIVKIFYHVEVEYSQRGISPDLSGNWKHRAVNYDFVQVSLPSRNSSPSDNSDCEWISNGDYEPMESSPPRHAEPSSSGTDSSGGHSMVPDDLQNLKMVVKRFKKKPGDQRRNQPLYSIKYVDPERLRIMREPSEKIIIRQPRMKTAPKPPLCTMQFRKLKRLKRKPPKRPLWLEVKPVPQDSSEDEFERYEQYQHLGSKVDFVDADGVAYKVKLFYGDSRERSEACTDGDHNTNHTADQSLSPLGILDGVYEERLDDEPTRETSSVDPCDLPRQLTDPQSLSMPNLMNFAAATHTDTSSHVALTPSNVRNIPQTPLNSCHEGMSVIPSLPSNVSVGSYISNLVSSGCGNVLVEQRPSVDESAFTKKYLWKGQSVTIECARTIPCEMLSVFKTRFRKRLRCPNAVRLQNVQTDAFIDVLAHTLVNSEGRVKSPIQTGLLYKINRLSKQLYAGPVGFDNSADTDAVAAEDPPAGSVTPPGNDNLPFDDGGPGPIGLDDGGPGLEVRDKSLRMPSREGSPKLPGVGNTTSGSSGDQRYVFDFSWRRGEIFNNLKRTIAAAAGLMGLADERPEGRGGGTVLEEVSVAEVCDNLPTSSAVAERIPITTLPEDLLCSKNVPSSQNEEYSSLCCDSVGESSGIQAKASETVPAEPKPETKRKRRRKGKFLFCQTKRRTNARGRKRQSPRDGKRVQSCPEDRPSPYVNKDCDMMSLPLKKRKMFQITQEDMLGCLGDLDVNTFLKTIHVKN